MKKYIAFFRMKFLVTLQYRTAAVAGIATQFVWGAMETFLFHAFYNTDAAAFPMTMSATAAYIWLQQAFLMLFMAWAMDNEPFELIMNGNIAYTLCRPIHIYSLWFAQSTATRLSKASLRCIPVLVVAMILPAPFGLSLPKDIQTFLWFIVSMILALLVAVAFCMLIYMLSFFTVSPMGLRMLFLSLYELLSGAVVPLPFFPDTLRPIAEMLPFAAAQNIPFRIYGGDLVGTKMIQSLCFQLFWLIVLVIIGRLLCRKAMKKTVIQGG